MLLLHHDQYQFLHLKAGRAFADAKYMNATQFVPIGNGSVIACFPDGISYSFEEDGTLAAWLDETPEGFTMRITCLTGTPESEAVPAQSEIVAEDAMERGLRAVRVGDKAYFVSDADSTENGEKLWLRFWEAGYLHNRLILTFCCAESSKNSKEASKLCRLVPEIIETLQQRETHSELTESELYDLQAQRDAIQEVLRERYGVFNLPAIKADLPILQQLIDERVFSPEQEGEWSCLGVVFGDVIAAELGLHWCAYCDEQGAEPALRLTETSITLFPRTMILKRIENSEEIELDAFIENLAESIEELKTEGC
jgi:hypothetical protein